MHVCCWNKMLKFSSFLANGHIMLNTPVLVRSLKLSNIEPSQYLDGWPPGNTGCCWLSFFSWFKTIFAFLAEYELLCTHLLCFWFWFWYIWKFMEIDRKSKKIYFREVSWLFLRVSESFWDVSRCFVFAELAHRGSTEHWVTVPASSAPNFFVYGPICMKFET